MRSFGWLGLLCCGLVSMLPPTPASACSCGHGEWWEFALPEPEAVGVPTNARVFLGEFRVSDDRQVIEWLDGDGGPVEFDRGRLGELVVLVARQPLAPNTAYHVSVDGHDVLSFTTGAGPDTATPAVPEITHVGEGDWSDGDDDSCGEYTFVDVEVRSDAELVLLDVASPTDFDPTTMTGQVEDLQRGGDPAYFSVGNGACGSTFDGNPGDSTTIRFAAMDGAGNLSAWSDPREVTLPGGGCACRSAGGADVGLLALGLAALALRRRR